MLSKNNLSLSNYYCSYFFRPSTSHGPEVEGRDLGTNPRMTELEAVVGENIIKTRTTAWWLHASMQHAVGEQSVQCGLYLPGRSLCLWEDCVLFLKDEIEENY